MTIVKNIEEHEYKLNNRQMAIYIGGIIFGTFMAAMVYFGINKAISDLGLKIQGLSVENASLKQDVRNLNTRFDQIQTQDEVRYLELKLELEKKQDKGK